MCLQNVAIAKWKLLGTVPAMGCLTAMIILFFLFDGNKCRILFTVHVAQLLSTILIVVGIRYWLFSCALNGIDRSWPITFIHINSDVVIADEVMPCSFVLYYFRVSIKRAVHDMIILLSCGILECVMIVIKQFIVIRNKTGIIIISDAIMSMQLFQMVYFIARSLL